MDHAAVPGMNREQRRAAKRAAKKRRIIQWRIFLQLMVMQVLLREQHPFIILLDNGFCDFFKPSDALFDACASGRVLLLSPWPYDATKRHISRADCVALNQMAEEICSM